MNQITTTILKWLGFAEKVETAILQSVPVASFGPAGNILGIALLSEEVASTVLQDLNAAKQQATTPAPAPAAPAQ